LVKKIMDQMTKPSDTQLYLYLEIIKH
jgi:hypothetical protein